MTFERYVRVSMNEKMALQVFLLQIIIIVVQKLTHIELLYHPLGQREAWLQRAFKVR